MDWPESIFLRAPYALGERLICVLAHKKSRIYKTVSSFPHAVGKTKHTLQLHKVASKKLVFPDAPSSNQQLPRYIIFHGNAICQKKQESACHDICLLYFKQWTVCCLNRLEKLRKTPKQTFRRVALANEQGYARMWSKILESWLTFFTTIPCLKCVHYLKGIIQEEYLNIT